MDENARSKLMQVEPRQKLRRWQISIRWLFWVTTLLALGLWLVKWKPDLLLVAAGLLALYVTAALEKLLYRWITGAELKTPLTYRLASSLHLGLVGIICGGAVCVLAMQALGVPASIWLLMVVSGTLGALGAIAGWFNV